MIDRHDIPGRCASLGFTLIELMISVTLASLLSLAVVAAYSNQAATFVNQGRSNQATEDGRDAFTVLSGLIRQAISSSLTINQTVAQTTIDFQIPPGFPIWPNTTPPYDRNAIRILWTNTGPSANQIRIASATAARAARSSAGERRKICRSRKRSPSKEPRPTRKTIVPAPPESPVVSVSR